ncbi:hypothetical protein KCU65_g6915, partial [Aureobasidium melanogenum]
MDPRELNLITSILPFGSKFLERTYTELRKRQHASRQGDATPGYLNQVVARRPTASIDHSTTRIDNSRSIKSTRSVRSTKSTRAKKKHNASADVDNGDTIMFYELLKKKTNLKVDKSTIHGQGVFVMENVASAKFIIEYVGETICRKIADLREIEYVKQGIECSYLFALSHDQVVDATKEGNDARFINHSCAPNCATKIINVGGTPRIVFYALKDIAAYTELTVHYNFEPDPDSDSRIRCLCGFPGCEGFLD